MVNVYPLNDAAEHCLDTTCDCLPRVEFDAELLVLHNSFDGREAWDGGPWKVQPSEEP